MGIFENRRGIAGGRCKSLLRRSYINQPGVSASATLGRGLRDNDLSLKGIHKPRFLCIPFRERSFYCLISQGGAGADPGLIYVTPSE